MREGMPHGFQDLAYGKVVEDIKKNGSKDENKKAVVLWMYVFLKKGSQPTNQKLLQRMGEQGRSYEV